MITETNFSKLKNIVKESTSPIIFSSADDNLNRKVMEKLPIDIILIPLTERKDYMKQRDSGFNQVMAKIAKKNNIQIGIDLDELIDEKIKSRILARVTQTIMLCNKNNVQMQFIQEKNKRDIYELKSLLLSLGAPTKMSKNLKIIFK